MMYFCWGKLKISALLCYVLAPSAKFYAHNALIVSALQPRDFGRQYFAAGEKATV
jgi:hypothetical protein